METVTPFDRSDDGPAPDVTGPDIVPAAGPVRDRPAPDDPMSASALVLAVLAGIGLASLAGDAVQRVSRHFRAPLSAGRRPAL